MKIVTYILTHNSPAQLLSSLTGFRAIAEEFIDKHHAVVMDQLTRPELLSRNQQICQMWDIRRIEHENTGASGGRWICALDFEQSDADLMFFFEDDMLLNSGPRNFCRFGFPSTVDRLWHLCRMILDEENLDYLKLSFHEVYFDHSKNFLTKNPAKFEKIGSKQGISYLIGDVYYSNWPMLIRKGASSTLFMGSAVTEGRVMERANTLIQQGKLRAGVLAAWPVKHQRLEDRPDRRDL